MEIKDKIKEKYNHYVQTSKNSDIHIKLDEVLSFMYDKEPNDKYFKQFFSINEKLDRIRNENWKESLKDLHQLLSD